MDWIMMSEWILLVVNLEKESHLGKLLIIDEMSTVDRAYLNLGDEIVNDLMTFGGFEYLTLLSIYIPSL